MLLIYPVYTLSAPAELASQRVRMFAFFFLNYYIIALIFNFLLNCCDCARSPV